MRALERSVQNDGFVAVLECSRKAEPRIARPEGERPNQEETMKKLLSLIFVFAFSLAAFAQNKTLVAYFSRIDDMPPDVDAVSHATSSSGNTRDAAEIIARLTDGDLYQIKTDTKYPVLHQENSRVALQENRKNARPKITSGEVDLSKYNTVYVCFPIWYYEEPMVIRTFLESHDFSGKTVVPVCTSMGAGLSRSQRNFEKTLASSTVKKGISLYAGDSRKEMEDEIRKGIRN